MLRAYPEDLIGKPEVRPQAMNYSTPVETSVTVYYDRTALILGVVALALVAMVCITALVMSRR